VDGCLKFFLPSLFQSVCTWGVLFLPSLFWFVFFCAYYYCYSLIFSIAGVLFPLFGQFGFLIFGGLLLLLNRFLHHNAKVNSDSLIGTLASLEV